MTSFDQLQQNSLSSLPADTIRRFLPPGAKASIHNSVYGTEPQVRRNEDSPYPEIPRQIGMAATQDLSPAVA